MDDPRKFSGMAEYHIFMYALGFLLISEVVIWFFTLTGSRDRSGKHSDQGTVWLIMIGWYCSVMAGVFFRSQRVPQLIRNLLLPHFTYYIGIVFIFMGVVVRCTAVWTLKRAFTLSVQTTDHQHLIQTGLYGIVRNPAYTGSITSLLGVALGYRHILGIIGVLVICFICYGIRIHVEEKALAKQFQQEFEQYCRETKYRLIPGIY
jgi:Putative protein-S-isoprenylcysteine methyltransferase